MAVELSVVIAVHQAEANVAAILAMLRPAAFPQVEFILCVSVPAADGMEPPPTDNVTVLECPADALVPLLWRDGLRAAHGERVALSSAHCIPGHDWLQQALAVDLDRHVGVGGSIDQVQPSSGCDWAIYFQRYARFCSHRPAGVVDQIAADNAVYRRADILRHPDLLELGFWEPSFHRRFAADGQTLWFNPAMNMRHKNRYPRRYFLQQRIAHGIAFGQERCQHFSPAKRLTMILLSPLIPLVFLVKLYRQAGCIRAPLRFIRSLPCLSYFVGGWSLGELKGYLRGPQQ